MDSQTEILSQTANFEGQSSRGLVETVFAAMYTQSRCGRLLSIAMAGLLIFCVALSGCGAGGYIGGGVASLSASKVTIDAGQSIPISATVSAGLTATWALSGTCSANGCGSLSATTGSSVVYTAPAGLESQMNVVLTAAIAGTRSSEAVSITVNPDPSINGNLPAGTVGTPYSTNLVATGGTTPLALTVTTSALPNGLTFSATTGLITGTPTVVGTFPFVAKVVDSSDVPFTYTVNESITITANGGGSTLVVVTGNPPAGTVGVAYTTTLRASGGTAPYSWNLMNGSLPAGLTLSPTTGVISGTPTAQGLSTFTAQATDSTGAKASTAFVITINSASVATLTLTTGTLPNGVVGTPYSATIGVSGGSAPYSCAITAGALPAGLLLGAGCAVTGTPTTAGTANLTVKATDAGNPAQVVSGPVSVTITGGAAASLTLTLATLPNGMVGTPYSSTVGVSGGTAPYSCVVTAGTLPAGLALSGGCVVSGTPTTAGTATVTVKATDTGNPAQTVSGPETITITPAALMLTVSSLPDGTVGAPYNSTIGVGGGTAPFSCSILAGTLPAGLTLGANCQVSGTPTAAGTANLTVKATDAGNPVQSTSGPVSLTINAAPLTLTLSSPPNGMVGTPYAGAISVNGGKAPYSCTITAGTLQAGLTLGANCAISGTPTAAGTANLTVKATDASNPTTTTTGPVTVTVSPAALSLTNGTLPNGTVGTPYSSTIAVNGGTAPYGCVVTTGTLPTGLTLGANCLVSGTPTAAGTSNVTVKATDSGNPAQSVTGPEAITIVAAPVLTLTPPAAATVGTPYTGTIGVTGGTAPYGCTITAGTLPAGLTLGANCAITGTPTTAGSTPVTVKATDSGNPVVTSTGPVTITVNPAALVITPGGLPNGTVGTPYGATIPVTGGTSPYTCTITAGTLPAGLTLGAACGVTGTPTVAGTSSLTVKATDSANPAQTATGPVSITINAAAPTLTVTSPPAGTVGAPYTGTIPVTGGTGPYICTITAGALPSGLALGANCAITGTPTAPGTTPVTIKATDSSQPPASTTTPITVTVNAPATTLTLSSPPNATVGTPYTGIIGVSGGTAPYSCAITAGTLPAGLTLGANCTVTGTPTAAGTVSVTVKATDSSNPVATTTGPVSITVLPVTPLTLTGTLPNATLGLPYAQTLSAAGGVGPYTYAVTVGSLPAGLSLNANTGVISGTPTVAGASSFTVKATDSENPAMTASLPLVLLVVYPTTANDSEFKGPYAFLFQGYDDVVAGVLAYQTASVGSFTADGSGVLNAGELDSNHQGSILVGNSIRSNQFVGTYTLGADHRGKMTITTLNADGATGGTATYAISLKAPVSPATVATKGSMIEFDNDQLRGTKGSGTILAQTAASFATGLSGSYAFGLSGDTPCLPACTVGIIAGPAAAVGQFNATGGALTGGSDANVATTKYANSTLSGTYGAADSNGRLAMSMTPTGVPTPYPTDYAVYVVSANQAFILSTDKHSEYILLAGSAQLQTLATFNNASLTGAYVGYENSPTNPGLVGTTIQNTLNLSTATVFRGTADAAGTCNTTNVDIGGVTGTVNALTGIGSGSNILNAVFGTYAQTGMSNCTVASNGRGVLNYPAPSGLLATTLGLLGLSGNPPAPRVVYLVSSNQGYFLETGYAGLGMLEQQTGAPFSNATLKGTFVYGTTPASSVATINGSGVFTADGNGHATSTLDLNVGVGTINVLQLGVSGTGTYNLTDATAGRYTYGTSVIYAINPGRFVLLDVNPLTTSPAVALLY